MTQAAETLEGWYALHDIRRLDRPAWEEADPEERRAALEEAGAFFRRAEGVEDAQEGSSAHYRVLGHKGDVLVLHLRPRIEDLHALEEGFEALTISRWLRPATSFVSVVELSQHTAEPRQADEPPPAFEELPEFVRQRLKPPVPEMDHICFYPMNRRRGEQVNWFTLSPDERAELMKTHANTGRKYAGRIVQMITGSTGFDDWEWGVTLFAHDPLQFKKLVYEMRFDRVSALYAEFGPFYTGVWRSPDGLVEELAGAHGARGADTS